MRLLPQLPAPFAASRFARDAEGWRLVTGPGADGSAPAPWSARPEGGGALAVPPPAEGEAAPSLAAPDAFLGARPALAGGWLALRVAAGEGASPRSGERGLVLAGADASVGLDVSAGGLTTAEEDGSFTVRAPVSAGTGWVDLETGAAADEALLRSVVAELRGLRVSTRLLAPAEGSGSPFELRTVEAYADPSAGLRPSVTLRYEDGTLTASWPASPFAASYRVRVRDADGAERLAREIAAPDLRPPVVLASDDFAPEAGEAYTVEVALVGPPASRAATLMRLEAPEPAAEPVADGVRLTWAAVAGGVVYDVRVEPAAGGDPVVEREGVAAAPLVLGEAEGLESGTEYAARVRARADVSVGPWSDPVAFTPLTPADVLRQLLERMVAHRPAPDALALDADTLPAGVPGHPDAVLSVVRGALGIDALTVTVAADPAVADDRLVLEGTAPLVAGDPDPASVTAVFTVDESLALRLELEAAPSSWWRLSDTLPLPAGTAFDALPLAPATLRVTTWDHEVEGVPVPLAAGLNLDVTCTVTSDLRVPLGSAAEGAVPIRFVGAVSTAPEPSFRLDATQPLPELTAAPLGRDPLTVTGATATLAYPPPSPGDGEAAPGPLRTSGRTTLAGQSVPVTVTLPTPSAPTPTLRVEPGALTVARLGDAAAIIAGTLDLDAVLPASLRALAQPSVTGLGFTWDPEGRRATRGFLELSAGDWPLAPGALEVRDATVELEVTQPPFGDPAAFGGFVSGTLALGGEVRLEVGVGVTSDRRWYAVVQDESARPPLEVLAEFLSTETGGLIPPLPASLRPLTELATPRELYFGGDPFAGTLDVAGFRFGQKEPWTAVPGVTVSGFSVAVTASRGADGWSSVGRLEGSVTLGEGDGAATFRVEMPVPPSAGEPWALRLEPGSVVHVPTIREIFDLLGREHLPLPEGLATLGGLDVTALALTFDPTVPALLHVGVRFAQSGGWTIIPAADPAGTPLLGASELSGSLSVRTGPLAALGSGRGVLSLLGAPVDFELHKGSFRGGWELRAGWSTPVHLPGLADLAGWMGAEGARDVLAGVPVFGAGVDVSRLRLAFGAEGGAPERIGFRVAAPAPWTVIPGKLDIRDVYAELETPHPTAAEAVTGSLGGVVTVAGASAQLRGAKSAPGEPWVFTGRLLSPVAIDLVAAANQVADAVLQAPADAAERWGLPPLTLTRAEVRAVPDTGAYALDAALVFTGWSFDFGPARLSLEGLAGRVERTGTDAPTVARVLGRLSFGSLRVRLGMQLGTAGTDTVLTGALTAEEADALRIGSLADDLSGAEEGEGWASVVPDDLPTALSGVSATLNLTGGVVLLTGTLTGYAWAYFFGRRAPVASGEPETETETVEYVFAAGLGEEFTFGGLLDALAPVDGMVRVRDARMAVYSVEEEGTAGLEAAMRALPGLPPTVSWPLPADPAIPVPARRGLLLSAAIELHTPVLFDRVLEIGAMGDPELRLTAVVDRDDPARSLFGAELPDITILQTVSLSGVVVTFRPAANDELRVAGDLAFGDVFGQSFGFHGEMVLTDADMTGTLSLLPSNPAQSVAQPFGVPGIVVEQLRAEVGYTFSQPGPPPVPTTSRFSMLGRVRLGRPPAEGTQDRRALFDARIALRDGAPALLEVEVAEELDVGALLAQVVTGDAGQWPSDFVELAFLPGSAVYYYDAAADPAPSLFAGDGADGGPRRDGFHVDARVELTLVETLALRFVLDMVPGEDGHYDGVRAAVGLEAPVDLLFVQVAGTSLRDDAYESGPRFALSTGDRTRFGFDGGINFLGRGLVAGSVDVSRTPVGDTEVRGRVETAQTFDPFGPLRFDFTYTRTAAGRNRFRIRNWPGFDWAREILDVAVEIKKVAEAAAASGACGSVARLATDTLLTTSYSVVPSADADGDDLVFGLAVACRMSIRGASEPFLTSTLPPVRFRVPAATHFDELPERMAEAIAAAGPEFARSLLADPDDLALFLAMTFGKAGVSIALELVCRGLADAAVPAATEAAAASIAEVAGGAAAVGGAVLGGIVATIGGILGGGGGDGDGGDGGDDGDGGDGGGGGGDDDDDGGDDDDDDGDGDGGGGGGGGDDPIVLGEPTLVRVTYVEGRVRAAWGAALFAAGYELQLLSGDRVLHSADAGQALEGEMAIDASALAAGSYAVRVVARRGDDRAPSASLPLRKLAAPGVSLRYADGVLTATPEGDGESFSVRFHGPDGAPLGEPRTVAPSASATLELPSPRGERYSASATARAEGQIPSDEGEPTTLELLAPPADLVARQHGTRLRAEWVERAGATGYRLRLLEGDAPVGDPVTGITAPEAEADLPEGAAPGATYAVQVRALAPDQWTDWSAPASLALLPVPARPALRYDAAGPAIAASWAGLPAEAGEPAYAYAAELLEADGGGVLAALHALTEPAASLPVPDAEPGRVVRVRVAAERDGSTGAWSDPAEVALEAPLSVAELRAVPRGESVHLSWTGPETDVPHTYAVRVTGPDDAVVFRADGLEGTEVAVGPPSAALAAGMRYTARVRVVTATTDHAPAAVEFALLTAPAAPALSFRAEAAPGASVVRISWTAVEGAVEYEVAAEVLPPPPPDTSPSTASQPTGGALSEDETSGVGSPPPPSPLSPFEPRGRTSDTSLSLTASQFAGGALDEGAVVWAAVRARVGDALTPPSAEGHLKLTLLAPPTGLTLAYRDGALEAGWTPDPLAREVELVVDGPGGSPTERHRAETPPVRWPRSEALPLAPGEVYTVIARSRTADSTGLPAEAATRVPDAAELAARVRSGGGSAADAAAAVAGLVPGIVFSDLLIVLAKVGFPAPEAAAAAARHAPVPDATAAARVLTGAYPDADEATLEDALAACGYSPEQVDAALADLLGPPLRHWMGRYATKTEWWGGYFDLEILSDGTVRVGGSPVAFTYERATARLSWDWQPIRTTRAKGRITFRAEGGGRTFSGSVNPRPQDGPVGYRGSLERPAEPWPSALGGSGNTGRSLFRGPARPTEAWRVAIGGRMRGGPAVGADGTIYVGGDDSRVYALRPDGSRLWEHASAYPAYPTPAVRGALVFSGADGLLALDAASGAQRWKLLRRDVGMIVAQPPVVSHDGATVYVLADSSTGEGDRLLAVDAADGAQRWEFVVPGGRSGSACGVGPDGTVYLGSESRTLHALDPATGQPRWSYQDPYGEGWIRGPVTVDAQGNVYYARSTQSPGANVLVCLAPDGTRRWEYAGGGYLANPPSIAVGPDGTLFVGFYGMHAVTPDGKRRWATPTDGNRGIYPGAAAVDRDGTVYFGASDGLYAYGADGTLRWTHPAGRSGSAPALAGDGALVFTDGAGGVILLRE